MKELTDFNLNGYVYVKLTDTGRNELKRQHDELYSMLPNVNEPYVEPEVDDDGLSKFQMWVLISSLGHLCRMGLEQPFETTIKIGKSL